MFTHTPHFWCCSPCFWKTYFGFPPVIPWFQLQEVTTTSRSYILKFIIQLTVVYCYLIKKKRNSDGCFIQTMCVYDFECKNLHLPLSLQLMSFTLNYLVIAVIFHVAFELALADCMILPRFVKQNCGQHHWHSSKRNRASAKTGVRKKKESEVIKQSDPGLQEKKTRGENEKKMKTVLRWSLRFY